MFDTVIVPLDGSAVAERGVAPAAEIARATGAALVLMTVVEDALYEDHANYLKGQTADLDVEVRPPYIIVADDAAACIANAGEAPASLVVMTTHGRTGIRRSVLGSVAERVVRDLARPVLLVGPGCTTRMPLRDGTLVIPVDGSPTSEAILPVATHWCLGLRMTACPVQVVTPDVELDKSLASGDVTEGAYVREVAHGFEQEGLRAEWDVLHQRAAGDAIVEFAAAAPAALIAMTTHGRTGLDRASMGSVAGRVLHDAPCPVLVLRPEGLV